MSQDENLSTTMTEALEAIRLQGEDGVKTDGNGQAYARKAGLDIKISTLRALEKRGLVKATVIDRGHVNGRVCWNRRSGQLWTKGYGWARIEWVAQ